MQWITTDKAVLKAVCTPLTFASCAGYEQTPEIGMISSVRRGAICDDIRQRQDVISDHGRFVVEILTVASI